MKLEDRILNFSENGINESAFHKRKQQVDIDKVDIRKIVIPNKDSSGKKGSSKYLIRCKSHIGIAPLCIKLPQLNGYSNYIDYKNKYVNLLFYHKKLLKKYNEIWDKISNLLEKGFDNEAVYSNKCVKIKINFFSYYKFSK